VTSLIGSIEIRVARIHLAGSDIWLDREVDWWIAAKSFLEKLDSSETDHLARALDFNRLANEVGSKAECRP
jgi:hypothetical protein